MMTNGMRQQLYALGFSEEEVYRMRSDRAQALLQQQKQAPAPRDDGL